jgi:glycine/D-amino acid oxidase-like deaminating enzyme
MEIHELLLLLQHEVQKSFDFVDEAVPHIALERVEVELPVILGGQDVVFDPKTVRGLPRSIRKLGVPFTPRTALERDYVPRTRVTGKTVTAEIIGPAEGADDRVVRENIGRIRVVLRPIIK